MTPIGPNLIVVGRWLPPAEVFTEYTYHVDDTNCAAQEGKNTGGGHGYPPGTVGDWIDNAFTSGEETTTSTDDGNDVWDNNFSAIWHAHRFDIRVTQSAGSCSQLDFTWKGFGQSNAMSPPPIAYGAYMYIWNATGTTWGSAVTSHAASSKTTLSHSITTSVSDYFDGSGDVYALILSNNVGDDVHHVRSYYYDLVVTSSE